MPPKKSPARRTPAKRSPVRKVAEEATYAINEVDAEPSKEIFSVMNYLAYLFVLLALAAGISWIYYVSKANEGDLLDDSTGNVVNTASVCFQATVVSVLLYFVARHHFHHLHY